MKGKTTKWFVMMALVVITVGIGELAQAISVTCGSSCPSTTYNITDTDAINDGVELAAETGNAAYSSLSRLLKQDSGSGGSETGILASSYTISITGPGGDEFNNFTVTYNGGATFSCPTCVLVVKDGNQGNPAQYAIDLGSWNGTTQIVGTGFWEGTNGSISHVALFASPGTSVPEPASLLMLGAGLAGLGLWRRKQA